MIAIFERELKSYFTTLTGYIYAAFLLLFAGIYTMAANLKGGYPEFEYALGNMCFIFIAVIPVLTMRVMADERRQRTDQLLYSLPLSSASVVMGKYLAMLVVIALPMVILSAYPLVLSLYGTINFKAAYGSLLAFYFLSATLAAIGMFVSSLMENQAATAGVCFAVMLLLYFLYDLIYFVSASAYQSLLALMVLVLLLAVAIRLLFKSSAVAIAAGVIGEGSLLLGYTLSPESFESLFTTLMQRISPYERFYLFLDGVFDVTALVYFVSVIGLFLFLCVQGVEKRRWNG